MADGGRSNYHRQECNCCHRNAYGVEQSLEEMDFHRSLGSACMTGDFQRIERLVSKGVDVNAEDASGYAPLHYASRNGHVRACSLLLKNGAILNKKTRGGQATSLHRAAYAGHENVVKILIDAGADVCAQDSDGCTALHKAVFQGHHGIVNLLMNASTKISEIRDNKELIKCGSNVDVADGGDKSLPNRRKASKRNQRHFFVGDFYQETIRRLCGRGPFSRRLYANDEKALTSRICGTIQIYYGELSEIQDTLFTFAVASSNLFCGVCWK